MLSHLYNIFATHFSSNFSLLKFHSSSLFNFSYLLTSALSLPSNVTTVSFVFSKFSSLFHIPLSVVNLFYCTKYFITSHTFLLFNIFSTSNSFTLSTSIGFTFSIFYPFTCSLYYTTQLIFTTRWILIEVGSCNLIILVDNDI